MMQHQTSIALSVAVTLNLADHLLPAGKEGLSADELSKKTGAHPVRITKAMRYLANKQIFSEPRENCFANNRDSLMLVESNPMRDYVSWQCVCNGANRSRIDSRTIDMFSVSTPIGLGFL
jgi:hypothetical protein